VAEVTPTFPREKVHVVRAEGKKRGQVSERRTLGSSGAGNYKGKKQGLKEECTGGYRSYISYTRRGGGADAGQYRPGKGGRMCAWKGGTHRGEHGL